MRVLVACEVSGVVRDAFRKYGHEAFSCDLLYSASPYHIQGDALKVVRDQHWDLMIAHPPCTYLSNSGVLRLYKDGKKINGPDSERWLSMAEGARFFRALWLAQVERICIENPVMHRYGKLIIEGVSEPGPGLYLAPPQTIQPYEFGDDASKRTCLWLKNLPRLKIDPAKRIAGRIVDGKERWANQTDGGWNKLAPHPGAAHCAPSRIPVSLPPWQNNGEPLLHRR